MNLINWIPTALPLIIFVIAWVALMVFLRWKSQTSRQKVLDRQNELLQQQLAVLREIHETIKQLREPRG